MCSTFVDFSKLGQNLKSSHSESTVKKTESNIGCCKGNKRRRIQSFLNKKKTLG